jgi:uncharacterized coiled-coil protein SlyX
VERLSQRITTLEQ